MKNCQEIAYDIEEIKKKFRRKRKSPDIVESVVSEQVKCESNSALIMCDKCNCWKIAKENCS